MEWFIDRSGPYIGEEDVYQELRDKFPIVEERVKKSVERRRPT
jgi:GTP pyrophosphokinase